jgi:hypothetical protein
MFSSKNVSVVYLVKFFQWKTAFSAINKPKSAGNRPFFSPFAYTPLTPSTTTPLPGHSPRQQLVDQAVFEPPSQSLPLSKWRYWASDYGCGMMLSLPLSYWSPGRSYMTSSHTAMSIYIAARIRVKYNFCFVLISSLIVNVISALFLVSCTISVISQKAVVELKNILSQPDSQGSTPGKLLLNLKSFENHSWKSKVICDCSYER